MTKAKRNSYKLTESAQDAALKGKAGVPSYDTIEMVKNVTNPSLIPQDSTIERLDLEAAKKLGEFIENNLERIKWLLGDDAPHSRLEKAALKFITENDPDSSEKIIALKKLKHKAVKKTLKNLPKSGSRFLGLFMRKDSKLRALIDSFLEHLEFQLLEGDSQQVKVTAEGLKQKLQAKDVEPTGNQQNLMFIISEGAVYQTDKLSPEIQKEFDTAQQNYNLTIRTPELPPKIVKTPASENLSPILPNVVVLFHLDLLLGLVLALVVYDTTPTLQPTKYEQYGVPPPNWKSDEYFMEQRVVGVNPCGISKMNAEQKKLFQNAGVSIPAQDSDYYVWDFRTLEEYASKQLPVCVLLAKYSDADKAIKPLAVHINTGGDTSPVLIKKEDGGVKWDLAKMCVRISEWNVHELGSHLTLCHFFGEMVGVLTHHYLPKQHPVFQLLLPHFFRTIPLNDDARSTLVPQVIANKLSSLTTDQAFQFSSKTLAEWDFQANYVPVNLAARGVMDLPDSVYPFRKTALDTWTAVRTYVQAVLGLLASMAAAEGKTIMDSDKLLRNWARGMAEFFTNFPDLIHEDNEALYDAITMMIYTTSHQHAAVNYYQAKYMSFIPAAPGRIKEFPSDLNTLTEEGLIALFPSYQAGFLQSSMGKVLSTEPEDKFTMVGFSRKPNVETKMSVEWPQIDNDLIALQSKLKETLQVYSTDSVNQKILAQSVIV